MKSFFLLYVVDFVVIVVIVVVDINILKFVLNQDSIGLMQQWHCLLKKKKIKSFRRDALKACAFHEHNILYKSYFFKVMIGPGCRTAAIGWQSPRQSTRRRRGH